MRWIYLRSWICIYVINHFTVYFQLDVPLIRSNCEWYVPEWLRIALICLSQNCMGNASNIRVILLYFTPICVSQNCMGNAFNGRLFFFIIHLAAYPKTAWETLLTSEFFFFIFVSFFPFSHHFFVSTWWLEDAPDSDHRMPARKYPHHRV